MHLWDFLCEDLRIAHCSSSVSGVSVVPEGVLPVVPGRRLPGAALSPALVRPASVGCDWLGGLSFLAGGSAVASVVSGGHFSCVPESGSLGSGLWVGGSHKPREVLRHSPLPGSFLASGPAGHAAARSSGITDWPPGGLCSSLFQRPVLSPPP